MKENSYNENELVYMVRQGDERSLQLLLELYRPRIRSIIRKNCTYQLQLRHQEKEKWTVSVSSISANSRSCGKGQQNGST